MDYKDYEIKLENDFCLHQVKCWKIGIHEN